MRDSGQLLTIEDHWEFVAFERLTALLLKIEVEGVAEHGLFFALLVRHEVVFLLHLALVVSRSILLTPTATLTL